jgi:formylglycine-generating enzyme required for sulfatase activity
LKDIELEIRITGLGGRQHLASVVRGSSIAGGGSKPFDLPQSLSPDLADLDSRDVRRRLEQPEAAVFSLLAAQGRILFDLLFMDGAINRAFQTAYQEARKSRSWLRLQFSFDRAPEAVDLPWEALVGPDGFALALLPQVSIERRLIEAPPFETPRSSHRGRFRALIAGASPQDLAPISVDDEKAAIESAFGRRVEVRSLEHSTLANLGTEIVAGSGFDLIHFLGHGNFDGEVGALVLENERGRGVLLRSDDLPAILMKPVPFVFLNVCHGGRSAAKPFSGLAQALLRSGVRAVVAMRREISDPGAVKLAKAFYSFVAKGESLARALSRARRSVFHPERCDWVVPMLFLADEDFALLPAKKPRWIWPAAVSVLAAAALAFWPDPDPEPQPRPWVKPELRCPAPPGIDMPMVLIEKGSFQRGSETSTDGDESPIHRVEITEDFCLGSFEVSRGLYSEVMRSERIPPPQAWFPVEGVPWKNTQLFVARLNELAPGAGFRLPSSAEWEYAARAGSHGDEDSEFASPANCLGKEKGDDYRKAAAIGNFSPNRWNLYEMKGNVWEWVEDWDAPYPRGLVSDPRGPTDGERKIRQGGSYESARSNCRFSTRQGVKPDRKQTATGFRIARDPVP